MISNMKTHAPGVVAVKDLQPPSGGLNTDKELWRERPGDDAPHGHA